MNPTTVTKCLVLQASSLLPELQEIVKSYAFYDTSSDEFQHHRKFQSTIQTIDEAITCRNNTNNTEWLVFTTNPSIVRDNVFLHAKFCKICGSYRNTLKNDVNEIGGPRIKCMCSYHIQSLLPLDDDE
jgi:hypothetical protein